MSERKMLGRKMLLPLAGGLLVLACTGLAVVLSLAPEADPAVDLPDPEQASPDPELERQREQDALALARKAAARGDVALAARALGAAEGGEAGLRDRVSGDLAGKAAEAARGWKLTEAERLLLLAKKAQPNSLVVRGVELDLRERRAREQRAEKLLAEAEAARAAGDWAKAERLLARAGAADPSPDLKAKADRSLAELRVEAERARSREEALAAVSALLDKGKVSDAVRRLRDHVGAYSDDELAARLKALEDLERAGGNDAYLPVRRALRWLAAHQSKDGGLHSNAFGAVCGDAECKKEKGQVSSDSGISGLALLGFTAFRDLDVLGEFTKPADRLAAFLAGMVTKEGTVPGSHYNHAIVALALFERSAAGAATKEEKAAADRVLAYLAGPGRLPDGGWRYLKGSEAADTSVTCWVMQALDAAKRAGAEAYPAVASEGLTYLYRCTAWDGQTRYLESGYGGRPGLSAAALLVRLLFGGSPDDDLNERAVATVRSGYAPAAARMSQKDGAAKAAADLYARWPDFYCWYYVTYAFHRAGGAAWKEWGPLVEAALTARQEGDGHFAGSWAPTSRWAKRGGRLYATAINALTLEVYYRHRVK